MRARLALLQAAYPEARVSRGLTKELNNFFVAAGGGWARLELRLDDGDSDREHEAEQVSSVAKGKAVVESQPEAQADAMPPVGVK